MRPAWPIWTVVAVLYSSLCASKRTAPSVAAYVDGQQVVVSLNYSRWSGYFNNQIQFVTGKSAYTLMTTCDPSDHTCQQRRRCFP